MNAIEVKLGIAFAADINSLLDLGIPEEVAKNQALRWAGASYAKELLISSAGKRFELKW